MYEPHFRAIYQFAELHPVSYDCPIVVNLDSICYLAELGKEKSEVVRSILVLSCSDEKDERLQLNDSDTKLVRDYIVSKGLLKKRCSDGQ